MMSKMLILLKKDVLGLLYHAGISKYKDDYVQKVSILSLILTSFSLFIMYHLFQTYMELFSHGFESTGVLLGKKITFGFLLLINFYYIYGLLESGEYFLLNSLPFSKKSIIISKILTMYMCDCIIEIIVLMPLCIVVGFSYMLLDIMVFFLTIPLVTVFVCSFLVFGLVMIEKMIKLGTIAKTVCIFMVISLIVSLLASNTIDFKYMNKLFVFSEMVPSTSKMLVFKFIIAVLLGYLSMAIIDVSLEKRKKYAGITRIRKNVYVYHKKKKYIAIFTGEVKQYMSLLPYVLNTGMGLVLIVLFSVNFYLSSKGVGTDLLGIPKGVLKNNIYVFPYILTLLVGACCSTQVSLSLEGKCVWIKKMIPVSNSTVYFEKVMVGLLLTFPVAIVSAIFILVSENIIIRDMFFTLIIIVLNLLLMSLIGILIDIKFVNYNWNNPTSVIKRSSGAIVYQITNILMNSIFILLVIRFKQTAVIRGICICLTIILLSYIYRIIVKKSIPD
ncbi:hypothetical protein PN298_07540 [Peptostreptococcus anaerobius]|uniref:hypothetical protein n=1 Tax=Peptostreptococcus anaerobius TaxID=1261 RepID=UPI00232D607B|nr:hypothetical protein [Peptostreptococcus anaerobius]MDB8850521.1 hypothetical protein [Peptostreptococcus anaerobius]MDB8854227.1 hypothetical protein [Peptostreptococcus anaerobius]MDB8856089.1 hypothetical protein [Peptostreptococcus anaerobius]